MFTFSSTTIDSSSAVEYCSFNLLNLKGNGLAQKIKTSIVCIYSTEFHALSHVCDGNNMSSLQEMMGFANDHLCNLGAEAQPISF